MASSGHCIVCGYKTTDRKESGGRKRWRCADIEECAVRRNARKRRPRPEAGVRAQCRRIAEKNAALAADQQEGEHRGE